VPMTMNGGSCRGRRARLSGKGVANGVMRHQTGAVSGRR
jgi:hypothetical protein